MVWSSFDRTYEAVAGHAHPWVLSESVRQQLEEVLAPAPTGTEWRFENPPRCKYCGAPLGESILHSIYYFVFPGSLVLDKGSEHVPLATVFREGVQHPSAERHGS